MNRHYRNPSPHHSGEDDIPTRVGLDIAQNAVESAKRKRTTCVIAGGLAMHLYGFVRSTTDVDVVTGAEIPLAGKIKKLSFGGFCYEMPHPTWGYVKLDVITRDDPLEKLYAMAAKHPRLIRTKLGMMPVAAPEYLAVMKYLAARGKDNNDFVYLATTRGLLNRVKVFDIVRRSFTKEFAWDLNQRINKDILVARFLKAQEVPMYEDL